MAAGRRTTVFKSGNSLAVRLPASFGAKAGQPVEVREEGGRWVVEPQPEPRRKIDLSFLDAYPPWTAEQLDEMQRFIAENREYDSSNADWSYFDEVSGARPK